MRLPTSPEEARRPRRCLFDDTCNVVPINSTAASDHRAWHIQRAHLTGGLAAVKALLPGQRNGAGQGVYS